MSDSKPLVDHLVESFIARGVKRIFGLPGGGRVSTSSGRPRRAAFLSCSLATKPRRPSWRSHRARSTTRPGSRSRRSARARECGQWYGMCDVGPGPALPRIRRSCNAAHPFRHAPGIRPGGAECAGREGALQPGERPSRRCARALARHCADRALRSGARRADRQCSATRRDPRAAPPRAAAPRAACGRRSSRSGASSRAQRARW